MTDIDGFSMIDVVVSFDTTGSMYPCIAEVRRKVAQLAKELFGSIPELRIGVVAHGDYIDERNSYVTKHLPLTGDLDSICTFVTHVGPTHGGDGPECYERVLHEVREFNWRDGAQRILVMIGDAPPHERGVRTSDGFVSRFDWREEAESLRREGVTIHAVHALRRNSDGWWRKLSEIGGGAYLVLSQFSHINELIGAVAHHANGSLDEYENELGDIRFNKSLAMIFDQLRGGTGFRAVEYDTTHKSGLVPVHPARFQVLHVDESMPIRDFVNASGATFRTGRGFYEFTKPVLVQENKEVILVDRETGDMFSGSEARKLIGLPFGSRGKIYPRRTSADGYKVFIQSNSYNRVLFAGTEFLYETE